MDGPAPGRDLGRVLLASCLEQVAANAGPLAAGGGTEEHIHEVRAVKLA